MIKRDITRSFSQASETYDKAAPVQRLAAKLVDRQLEGLKPQNALEIGCGTGFLTGHLLERFPETAWTITDISPEMMRATQATFAPSHPGVSFDVLDGEKPGNVRDLDLIVSNLAFQWFEDSWASLWRLLGCLKPGGKIILSTLGPESFCEWRAVLEDLQLDVGLHAYPSMDRLKALCPGGAQIDIQTITHLQDYPSSKAFLSALKDIGAKTPRAGYKPMSPGTLRKALRQLDRQAPNGCQMTYDLMIVTLTKG